MLKGLTAKKLRKAAEQLNKRIRGEGKIYAKKETIKTDLLS